MDYKVSKDLQNKGQEYHTDTVGACLMWHSNQPHSNHPEHLTHHKATASSQNLILIYSKSRPGYSKIDVERNIIPKH